MAVRQSKRNALIKGVVTFRSRSRRIGSGFWISPNGTESGSVYPSVINPELLANQLQAESMKIDQSGVTF